MSGWCAKQTLHSAFEQISNCANDDICNGIGLLFMDEFDSSCDDE